MTPEFLYAEYVAAGWRIRLYLPHDDARQWTIYATRKGGDEAITQCVPMKHPLSPDPHPADRAAARDALNALIAELTVMAS